VIVPSCPHRLSDQLLAPIDRLAILSLPPRLRHRYNGVPAPNSPLRAVVTALARDSAATPAHPAPAQPVGSEGS